MALAQAEQNLELCGLGFMNAELSSQVREMHAAGSPGEPDQAAISPQVAEYRTLLGTIAAKVYGR